MAGRADKGPEQQPLAAADLWNRRFCSLVARGGQTVRTNVQKVAFFNG